MRLKQKHISHKKREHMNKKLICLIISAIIAGVSLISNLYCEEQSQDEEEFKNIATEFNAIMKSFDLEAKDYQKEAQKLQSRTEILINNLKSFILKYPNSKYVDDTDYILTLFWQGQPEKYIQELKLFLEKYPGASLEEWTLTNLETMSFEKEISVINIIKFNLIQAFYNLRKFGESATEARQFIDSLDNERLTEKGQRIIPLVYFYLMKDYEALGNTEEVKEVCKEAIERIQNPKDKESFIKKLKELGSL